MTQLAGETWVIKEPTEPYPDLYCIEVDGHPTIYTKYRVTAVLLSIMIKGFESKSLRGWDEERAGA